MPDLVQVRLADVQETLLLPLWGRAVETQKKKPLLHDPLAVAIIKRLDYDFASIARTINPLSQLGWVARCLLFDGLVRRFLERHPRGTVVNLGCGFDTTFERVDNGSVRWYDLDLPDVITARKQLLAEHPRRTHIAQSFLENGWHDAVPTGDGVLFMSAGGLYYFTELEIRNFLKRLADRFPGSEIVFDATPNVSFSNRVVLKRGKFNALLVWGLKDPAVIESWDERITVAEAIPMFRDARKMMSGFTRLFAAISDRLKLQYVVRLEMRGR